MQFGSFKRGKGGVCPQCGAALEPGDLFCINCGAKVSGGGAAGVPGQAGPVTGPVPSNGDHTVLVGGPAPVGGPAANMGAVNAGFASGAMSGVAPSTGAGLRVCPVCGQPVSEDADFCVSCGSRLSAPSATPDPVPSTMPDPYKAAAAQVYQSPSQPAGGAGPNHTVIASSPAVQAPGGGTCPRCNAPVSPGDLFCVSCGCPLGQQPAVPQQSPAPAPAKASSPQTPGPVQPTVQPKVPAHSAQGMYGAPSSDPGNGTPQIKEEAPITSRPQLVLLTREEARIGCSKTIMIDGQAFRVDIPAGVTSETLLDLPGIGYFDTETGERGSVRLSFFID